VLRFGDTVSCIEQRSKLRRRELAESLERRASWKRSDTHEAHDRVVTNAIGNPIKELNEVQLIEEVVLEPEDQFVVCVAALDHRAPVTQVIPGLVLWLTKK